MKKKLVAILIAVTMLFSIFAYTPLAFAQEKESDSYGEYAYSVLQYIDKNLNERRVGTDKEKEMADYVKAQLESFGYEVEVQPFTYTRKGETYNSQNIIVTKKGNSSKEVIVGAHYDSVGTHGVDDNGSGTVVNLETAKRFVNKETPYTVKFVFFGAEEVGLKGSKAYSDAMTDEEVDNTLYMLNMDSILAGTYRYIYSGNYNDETGKVENAWPVYQAMQLSNALGTGMRYNDTELNLDYPTPSTGNWSDHASFRNKLPYLYFEAVNWELPDDPDHPEEGSSGAYETEIGEVMHVPDRDNLDFIESTWGTRGKDTITAYCTLLDSVICQLSPDGLITPQKDDLKAAIEKAEKMDKDSFSAQAYKEFEEALKEAKEVENTEYVLLKDQNTIDKAAEKLNKAMQNVGYYEKIEGLSLKEKTATSLEISWDKVNNASGYKVYKYNTKTKKYALLATIHNNKKTTYKDDKLISATNYYYKVAAYKEVDGKDYVGPTTKSLKATTKPLQPVVKLSSTSKGKVKLTYTTKVSKKTDGYKIYMSTSKNGVYKLLKDTEKTTYNKTGLKSKKGYYFKVRAYRAVDGKNVYSSYSTAKYIKVK